MRLLPLLPLLFAACLATRDRGLGGQEGEDLTETGVADTADSDTGADDTASDTDSDTQDSGTDTADTGAVGTFTGPFVLDGVDGGGLSDRCTGDVAITLVGAELSGVGSCTFAGALAASFPDGVTMTVDGTVSEDSSVAGTVTFTTGASGDLGWTGTLAGDTLVGAFTGATGGATPLTVSGSFDATR